ncbi:MAG: MbnH family di-heme enzyme [Vicinamibacterales bacterium]
MAAFFSARSRMWRHVLAVSVGIYAAAVVGQLVVAGQASYGWDKPAWVPEPVVPADNPMSEAKVALGRHLFYDTRLSVDGSMSCGTCHLQEKAFTDGRALSPGVDGKPGVRSAMSLTNVAYLPVLTWANPTQKALERQMLTPIFGRDPIELGMEGREADLIARLAADSRYRTLFHQAYPDDKDPVTLSSITKAIASFERTLISFESPYDKYKYGRQPDAISAAAKRGEALFFGEELECSHCHGGFTFTDNVQHRRLAYPEFGFHNTGLYDLDGKGAYPADNHGIRPFTGDAWDEGKFRSPSLRNIAVTAPYMHDGAIATLREVITGHYAVGGRAAATSGHPSPLRDSLIVGFKATEADVDDLVAFLESLTDPRFLTNPALSNPWPRRP